MEAPTNIGLIPKKRVLLVDGNHIGWRWGMSRMGDQLRTSTGIVTTICYGVVESIVKANKCLNDHIFKKTGRNLRIYYDDVIVCWDSVEDSWRKRYFQEYKANRNDEKRKRAKEEIHPYFDIAKRFLYELGVAQFSVSGFEGDDLIGLISRSYSDNDGTVTIVSGDKDLYQLLEWGKIIIHDGKDTYIDESDFISDYGFRANRWIEAKAIMGDSGDNIPGVKGIGPKTAVALVNNVLNVFNLKDVKSLPKIKRLSSKGLSQFQEFIDGNGLNLNYHLVKIPRDISEIPEEYRNSFFSEYTDFSYSYNAVAGRVETSSFINTLRQYEMIRFIEDVEFVSRCLGLVLV